MSCVLWGIEEPGGHAAAPTRFFRTGQWAEVSGDAEAEAAGLAGEAAGLAGDAGLAGEPAS